jgi:hypothetical protein
MRPTQPAADEAGRIREGWGRATDQDAMDDFFSA